MCFCVPLPIATAESDCMVCHAVPIMFIIAIGQFVHLPPAGGVSKAFPGDLDTGQEEEEAKAFQKHQQQLVQGRAVK